MGRRQLLLWLVLPLLFLRGARGKLVEYDWIIQHSFARPDCVEKLVFSINGEFPGPLIEADVGDTVRVNVTNHLDTEGVVIHWHGIIQVRYLL